MIVEPVEGENKTFNKGLVSVIIPTYNRAFLLSEAIQSVVAQTYRPIECIVVDDGSIDDTKAITDKISKDIDNQFTLNYILQNNSGAQVARNTGTTASSGEFIQYLDSDDLLYADKLQHQVAYLNNNKDCDGVFGDWEVGDVDNKETIVAKKEDDLIAQLLTGRCISNFSFLMRSAIVSKIGEWDVNIKRNQEVDFHLRGVLAGGNFDYQSLQCGLWRTHSDTRIANSSGLKEVVFFFQKWERILKSRNELTIELNKGISNLYFWFCFQSKATPDSIRIMLLTEAVRMNPLIPFFNTKKMRLLNEIFGKSISLRCWLFWSKRNMKE